jgi:acetyltransferase-like isoleucine patch superfamily enzyme/coenzyme F420-reducing hydrogenase beta subunit
MINIQNKADCCGCNACGDVCTHKAISFKTDYEGFWYPEVDMKKCVDCHLCEKVCPIINIKSLKKNGFDKPECFAAQTKNLESLFNSTSGSAFASFAEKVYKQGGYVGGAVFNEDFSVKQFISPDKEDLEKLRNTKYVQSNSEGFFILVRDLLKAGELVLVCGLPCQMAGLRSFLSKDYENLIIVDLICLGINSPKILPAYLKWQEEKHGSKIIYYKAKNKELGWRQLTTKIVFENGDVEYDKKDTNYFTHGFIGTHAYARPSCYDCKFKGFPRIADITIGDFWGADKYVGRNLDNDLGTSVILINSQKGKIFYESTRSKFNDKTVPLDAVIKGNGALISSLPKPTFDREKFYNDLENLPFKDFADKYIKLPVNTVSAKSKLKNILSFFYYTTKASGFSLRTWWQNINYNLFSKQFSTDLLAGRYIIIHQHCVLDIKNNAKVYINGTLKFGIKRIKGSRLESRLLVENGSTLIVGGGSIYYGADIEVFAGATLQMGRSITFNINSTIICGDHIVIADNVCFGRNVTVRDNSGNHFMSRKVYKNKRPVTIGQHSWITEQSMVMPGSKIGVGVIVGAGSIVSGKLPNFTLAAGRPAVVVDEDIYWKA